jgi:hypothetical protein
MLRPSLSTQVLLSGFHLKSPDEACFVVSSAPPRTEAPPSSSGAILTVDRQRPAATEGGAGEREGDTGSAPAALLVVLDAGELEGEFSDNLLTLEPCGEAARRVCFSTLDVSPMGGRGSDGPRRGVEEGDEAAPGGQGSPPLDIEHLRGNLTAVALNAQGGLWWSS